MSCRERGHAHSTHRPPRSSPASTSPPPASSWATGTWCTRTTCTTGPSSRRPWRLISSGPGPVALAGGRHPRGRIRGAGPGPYELIRELDPGDLSGTVIIVPAANSPAVRGAARVSPIDAGNLNRSQPGPRQWRAHRAGSRADCRSLAAARRLRDRSCTRAARTRPICRARFIYRGPDEGLWREKVRAARLLGLPYVMVVAPLLEPGSLSSAGDLAGIPTISTELSGAGTVDRHALGAMRSGMPQLLAGLGILKDPAAAITAEPQWLELVPESPVTSTAAGLFEPLVDLGESVRAGQSVARVHFIDELDRPPRLYQARIDGVVGILRRPTLVAPGTHLMHIAPVLDPTDP